jgi:serine phosphatase RsbU (regulator of sigma subunit)
LAATDTGGPTTQQLPPSTILVVDDGPVNLQVLVRTLNGTGHRILAAKDGRAALDIARRARPDLILLDVMMPELDGFEVCRTIKADPEIRDTLVIFLSALGDVTDKVAGLKLGAVDYITKPIQAEEVLARVDTHLTRQYLERELRRSRDRLDRELAGAAGMQRLLLPPAMPRHASVEFAAHYRTSRHAGGDYYDVIDLGGGRYGLIVADVSGHGAPAAIVMAMIRAVLRTHPSPEDPPAVLRHINEHFRYLWDTAIFATAVYGVLDANRLTLHLSCAGHPPPLLARRGGRVSELPVDSVIPLFIDDIRDVPCTPHSLRPGDRVVVFTDGITDRQSSAGTMYDEAQLMSAIANAGFVSAATLVARLVDELDGFAGGQEPADDQTLLVVGVQADGDQGAAVPS